MFQRTVEGNNYSLKRICIVQGCFINKPTECRPFFLLECKCLLRRDSLFAYFDSFAFGCEPRKVQAHKIVFFSGVHGKIPGVFPCCPFFHKTETMRNTWIASSKSLSIYPLGNKPWKSMIGLDSLLVISSRTELVPQSIVHFARWAPRTHSIGNGGHFEQLVPLSTSLPICHP